MGVGGDRRGVQRIGVMGGGGRQGGGGGRNFPWEKIILATNKDTKNGAKKNCWTNDRERW